MRPQSWRSVLLALAIDAVSGIYFTKSVLFSLTWSKIEEGKAWKREMQNFMTDCAAGSMGLKADGMTV